MFQQKSLGLSWREKSYRRRFLWLSAFHLGPHFPAKGVLHVVNIQRFCFIINAKHTSNTIFYETVRNLWFIDLIFCKSWGQRSFQFALGHLKTHLGAPHTSSGTLIPRFQVNSRWFSPWPIWSILSLECDHVLFFFSLPPVPKSKKKKEGPDLLRGRSGEASRFPRLSRSRASARREPRSGWRSLARSSWSLALGRSAVIFWSAYLL